MTSTIQTILIASDLSERSDRALRRAMKIAQTIGANCHVVTVVDSQLPEDLTNTLVAQSEDTLKTQVRDLEGDAKIQVKVGDPLSEISQHAHDIHADLLVLGVHRPRKFLDFIRETTMERLVKFSDIPVLLVKTLPNADYHTVLAPTAFSPACANALKTSQHIVPNAEVEMLHAVHIPFPGLTGDGPSSEMAKDKKAEAEQHATEWAQRFSLNLETIPLTTVTDEIYQALHRKLGTDTYDLVAIGAHTRHAPSRHVGSFASELIRKSTFDLLVAQPAS